MVRSLAVAAVLSCLAAPAWAQAQPAASAAATTATSVVKPPAKRHAPRPPADAKPHAQAPSGRCLGVIPAAGDRFMVKKIGLTVFGNETKIAPIEAWGLDDLIVARVRVAAGAGVPVLRLAYPKDAFEPYYDPQSKPFRNSWGQLNSWGPLTAIVRRIAAGTNCRRYVVVTGLPGAYSRTNETLSGVGVFQASLFKKTYLFAYIHVTVFDGENFAIRKNPYATIQSRLTEALLVPRKDFNLEIDSTLFPLSAAEAANSTTLRDGARAVLTERLDDLLPAFLKE
jgi:hypothetical protein